LGGGAFLSVRTFPLDILYDHTKCGQIASVWKCIKSKQTDNRCIVPFIDTGDKKKYVINFKKRLPSNGYHNKHIFTAVWKE
jgi:hypothetical protein